MLFSSSMMVSGFGSGEMGDPAIKLFGKTIPLTENGPCSSSASDPDLLTEPADEDNKDTCKETTDKETTDDEDKGTPLEAPGELEQGDQNSLSTLTNPNETDHQTSSQDVVENSDPKSQQDQSEADVSGQEKVLKKPDKILPCPRCNSLDTKFCYYNNYNVNQPRHFCKNCQRYWTAGGTMRNVPVGAGRRKNKHSSSHYRHMMMSPEALSSAARGDATESTGRQAHSCGPAPVSPLKGSGTVLKFGSEAPLCESMSSVLNLHDQKRTELTTEEPACASNCAESEFPENAARKEPNGMHGYCNGFTPMNPPMHPMQCYPGPPWAYQWGPGWNNISAAAAAMAAGRSSSELSIGPEAGNMGSIQWAPPPMLAGPAFCAPTISIPFMPPAFWAPGAWAVPWASPVPNGGLSPLSSTSNSDCSGNGSPTLGKHSRDANLDSEEKKSEKSLWVPKTLRIDDPDEAAKSSIWATLGIKPDEGGMFRAFQSRAGSKGQKSDAPKALCANPAAMSRSQSFQETT